MGFLIRGVSVNAAYYSPTYLAQKNQESTSVEPQQQTKTRVKKKPTKSILERLPLELLYEIYIYSNYSNLNRTNKHFHRVLDFTHNKYLIQKLIVHNLHHTKDSHTTIVNVNVLRHKFLQLDHLLEFGIDHFAPFNPKTNVPDSDEVQELDFPERFYYATKQDAQLISYLLSKNLTFKDPAKLMVHLTESPDLVSSEKNLKFYLTKHEFLDEIEPLITALRAQRFDLARWLVEIYYNVASLSDNENLWSYVAEVKSLEVLQFLISLGVEPNSYRLSI